jgi:pilus assembly protein Flp/PilA
MKTYLGKIMAFISDEEGASAIEYGLLVGLIALAIVVGATALGQSINGMFNRASVGLVAVAP